jgi:hypothetical protein
MLATSVAPATGSTCNGRWFPEQAPNDFEGKGEDEVEEELERSDALDVVGHRRLAGRSGGRRLRHYEAT